jgi:hypothetical protein
MGLILLGLLFVFGVPLALAMAGFALTLWLAMAVAGLVWGIIAFLFKSPILAVLIGIAIGVAIGRASAQQRLPPPSLPPPPP